MLLHPLPLLPHSSAFAFTAHRTALTHARTLGHDGGEHCNDIRVGRSPLYGRVATNTRTMLRLPAALLTRRWRGVFRGTLTSRRYTLRATAGRGTLFCYRQPAPAFQFLLFHIRCTYEKADVGTGFGCWLTDLTATGGAATPCRAFLPACCQANMP